MIKLRDSEQIQLRHKEEMSKLANSLDSES